MRKSILTLAIICSFGILSTPTYSDEFLPGDGSGGTCKVELINCNWSGTVTRQICHVNGTGITCNCGDSTKCP